MAGILDTTAIIKAAITKAGQANQVVEALEAFKLNGLWCYIDQIQAIQHDLDTRAKSQRGRNERLPAVFVLMDFPQTEQRRNTPQYTVEAELFMLIVAFAEDSATTWEGRKDKTFKPLLWPITDAVLNAFDGGTNGVWIDKRKPIVRIDRPRLTQSFNEEVMRQRLPTIFNEKLDGVELRNVKVKFKIDCI